MNKKLLNFYNKKALILSNSDKSKGFLQKYTELYLKTHIPAGAKVLELGCGDGGLLNALEPGSGYGVDFSPPMITLAKKKYPKLRFICSEAEFFNCDGQFDYIVIQDLINQAWDVQQLLENLSGLSHPRTRIFLSVKNPVLNFFWRIQNLLKGKSSPITTNLFSGKDLRRFISLANLDILKSEKKLLFPYKIPLVSTIFNKVLANIPLINQLCLKEFLILRPQVYLDQPKSVSIIMPAQNERGNIENAIKRIPGFGKSQEFIFIEGKSSDGTYQEMKRVQEIYPDKSIRVFKQSGKGKANAVREAFDKASGEVLMILDTDLTTPPEDLNKFYDSLVSNKGEFINGSRLVYPMEQEAMRPINYLANHFFGWLFSYLLGQAVRDTLCGTKVLYQRDYEKIKSNRDYFGDFDLLFGASKLNLKIIEVNVRYRVREYGSTQISRFKHGLLLFKMSFIAFRKLRISI